ncbi:tyrosine-type recombinase/integrase [Rhizobium sp. HT1-10]|uniref:tyrosine-type recombinase/integrase n=1 Tax=Rhizobium sp. HT1-10 TaxID=3111638 RepID=UPI003C1BA27D
MTRVRALTEEDIAALKPKRSGERYDHPDPLTKHLCVRVGKKKKVFVFVVRFPGSKSPTRKTIGDFPAMSLDAARQVAAEWTSQIVRGIDPKAEAARLTREHTLSRRSTFRSVMEDYIEYLPTRKFNRHALKDAATLRHDVMDPARNPWLDKPIADVTDEDISDLIVAIKADGHPVQALQTFSLMKTFYLWAISPLRRHQYGLDVNPLRDVKPIQLNLHAKKRKVLPTTNELRAYWTAAEHTPYPYGRFYKALVLTGAVRRTALANARWSQFDLKDRVWTVPEEMVKNGEELPEHKVPLTKEMMQLLEELRANQHPSHGDFIFSTTNGQKPINSFGKAVTALRAKMAVALNEIAPEDKVRLIRLHDTRKLVRSSLSNLGVRNEVSEAVIGHSKKGIEGVYDLHRYLPQMRKALDLFCSRLMAVIDGTAIDFFQD